MKSIEDLYRQRLSRYLTAMRNEKPDRIPIRPFVASGKRFLPLREMNHS